MMKKILVAGGVLAVAIVAAVVLLASNLDSIVEKAIESLGPDMTRTSVKVKKVTLALTDSRGEIAGLVVGNPKGYKESHAFRLGSITLALDPVTITRDVIVIKVLKIEAPDMVYEKGPGGSNVEVIQRNADEYVRTRFGSGKAPDKSKKSDTSAQRFIIESLQIRNGKVRIAGIVGKDADVALPAISLRDVGRSRGGMTGAEIGGVVVRQMTDAMISSVGRALAQKGADQAKGVLKGKLFGR